MIRLALTADALAETHFAVSPLMQAGVVLHPLSPAAPCPEAPSPARLRAVLSRPELSVISAFRSGIRGYTPDFMTPGTRTGPVPDLTEELHRVATTPTSVVARQMRTLFASSAATSREPDRQAALVTIRRHLDRGEGEFAHRIADEMEAFWSACLAPSWPAIRSSTEADLDHRARLTATSGLKEALNSLHPKIRYQSGALHLTHPRSFDAPDVAHIIMFPSPLARCWLISIDPWSRRGVYLIYPTRRNDDAHGAADDNPLAGVLGRSRMALLADLATPRTTTELADRHRMSPSTVSYHLTRLHRAGMVTRSRNGKHVHYRRTRLLTPPLMSKPTHRTRSYEDGVLSSA